jgi:hypothetical protein
MSIFAAEINGRTSEEDQLLSRFFGTVAVADRARVLGAILPELGLEIAKSDLTTLKFDFWQQYFRATPSVVLEAKSGLVFFEAPTDIAKDRWRLFDQCAEGIKGNGHFALVLITRDATEPAEVAALIADIAARHRTARAVWTNWQRLYKKVHALARTEELDEVSRRLLGDLIALFEEKGLGGFIGFEREGYERAMQARSELASFARLTNVLLAEVNAVLDAEGIRPLANAGGNAAIEEGFHVPGHARFAYFQNDWDASVRNGCHYVLKLFLSEPSAWVAYRFDLSDAGRRALLQEKRTALDAAIESRDGVFLTLESGEEAADVVKIVRAGDGGLGFLEARDALRGVTHAHLVLPISEADLSSEGLSGLITERFLWLRGRVASLGLTPDAETAASRRFVVTNH